MAVRRNVYNLSAEERAKFIQVVQGLTIGGAFALQGSNVYLSDAVDRYNEDLFERLQGGAIERSARPLVLNAKHTF